MPSLWVFLCLASVGQVHLLLVTLAVGGWVGGSGRRFLISKEPADLFLARVYPGSADERLTVDWSCLPGNQKWELCKDLDLVGVVPLNEDLGLLASLSPH